MAITSCHVNYALRLKSNFFRCYHLPEQGGEDLLNPLPGAHTFSICLHRAMLTTGKVPPHNLEALLRRSLFWAMNSCIYWHEWAHTFSCLHSFPVIPRWSPLSPNFFLLTVALFLLPTKNIVTDFYRKSHVSFHTLLNGSAHSPLPCLHGNWGGREAELEDLCSSASRASTVGGVGSTAWHRGSWFYSDPRVTTESSSPIAMVVGGSDGQPEVSKKPYLLASRYIT